MSQGKTDPEAGGGTARQEPAYWVVRVSRAIGAPLWLAVLVLGLLPFPVLLVIGVEVARAPPSLVSEYIIPPQIPLTLTLVLLPIISSLYISRTVRRIEAYARTLLPGGADSLHPTTVNLSSLYTTRYAVLLSCALLVSIDTLYYFVGAIPVTVFSLVVPAYLYAYFVIGGTIWMYGYSIYSIWKIGRLQLELKHFTEDRMLGLKPFGTASLRLTLSYVLIALAGCLDAEGLSLPVRLSLFAAFSIPGVVLFLVPLFGLHRKLSDAKNGAMEWISKEHSSIMKEMEVPGGLADGALSMRLATVRSIRDDVKSIREWPFDSETIVRLVTLILVPLLIALGAPFLIHYL